MQRVSFASIFTTAELKTIYINYKYLHDIKFWLVSLSRNKIYAGFLICQEIETFKIFKNKNVQK